MADAKKQCSKCKYWTGCNGNADKEYIFKFCHHLLWTDKRRVEVDGVCLSFEKRGDNAKKTRCFKR